MTKPTAPAVLYYVTVYFENGYVLTPNVFVRPTAEEAFNLANKIVMRNAPRYQKMSARKMEYVESFPITEDFYHTVSNEDHQEWSPEFNREMVEAGEEAIPEVLVTVLTGKIENKDDRKLFPKGSAYFLDEWYYTTDVEEARELMKESNLPLFIPAEHAHLYRPTEEVVWSGWN